MATRMRVQRVRRDMSPRDLAVLAECRHQTISKVETQEWSVGPALARRIAAVMTLPLSTLFEEKPGEGHYASKMILWAKTDVVK